MRKLRKMVAIVMALVTLLAMTALPVSATVTYPYLTTANGTAYTTVVDTTGTNLYVQKYGSDWNVYPFASITEVGKVTWTWPYGGGDNFTKLPTSTPTTGGYYAVLNIKAKSTATSGAYTVRATYNDGVLNPYIDLTVIVTASTSQSASVTVEVNGTKGSPSLSFSASNTVTAQAGTYNYATPIMALDAMIGTTYGTSIYSYTQSGGYVNSVTGYINSSLATDTKTENWNTGDGWQYRVYHLNGTTYVRDDSSELIGASAYKLSANDYVKWVFCNYSEISTYFPSSF